DVWLGRWVATSAMGEFRAAAAAARAAARDAAVAKNGLVLGRALRAQAILAEVAPHCRTDLPRNVPASRTYPECITSGLLQAAAGDPGRRESDSWSSTRPEAISNPRAVTGRSSPAT